MAIWTCLACVTDARAQIHEHGAAAAGPGWSMAIEAQAFISANLQVRKFTDFYQVESPNWFMAKASRGTGPHRLAFAVMTSLEPFTLRRLGSAQVFQTGETLDGAPLIDYQHPHDLIMGLEATYAWVPSDRTQLRVTGGPVGEATIGPPAVMHRASAAGNPTIPLSHHQLDSTHISRSVVAIGLTHRVLTLEASAFKGREPDEDRLDLDLGAPDSWAARVSFAGGAWSGQISGGHLRQPEPNEPFDVTKFTASMAYHRLAWKGDFNLTVAAGRNQEFYGNKDAWLMEGAWQRSAHALHLRVESAEKNILTAGGLHPPGFTHPHITSRVGAATLGYAHTIARARAGRFSLGADATMHAVPRNLRDSYGARPFSAHAYLHWTFGR